MSTSLSEAIQANENLEDSLKCSLCSGYFQKPHTFGGCGHTFCYKCVIDTLEGPGIIKSQCPTCKAPRWKKDLIFNHAINNIVEHLKDWEAATERSRTGLRQKMRKRQQLQSRAEQDVLDENCVARTTTEHGVLSSCKVAPESPAVRVVPAHRLKQQQKETERGMEKMNVERPSVGGAVQREAAQHERGSWHSMETHTLPASVNPATPDTFGAAWVQRMLALPTPAPALAERLRHELSLLDEAVRLCDELPCIGDLQRQQPGAVLPEGAGPSVRPTSASQDQASRQFGCQGGSEQALEGEDRRPCLATMPAAATGQRSALACLDVIPDSEDPSSFAAPQPPVAAAGPLGDGGDAREQARASGRKRHKGGAGRELPSHQQQGGDHHQGPPHVAGGSRPYGSLPPSAHGHAPGRGPTPPSRLGQCLQSTAGEARARADEEPQPPPQAAVRGPWQAAACISDSDDDFQPAPHHKMRLERNKGATESLAAGSAGRAVAKLKRKFGRGREGVEHDGAVENARKKQGLMRKRSAAQHMQQAENMVAAFSGQPSGQAEAGDVVIGSRVRVLWEEGYFTGTITNFRPATDEHFIVYRDGDRQWHRLEEEEWEVLDLHPVAPSPAHLTCGAPPAARPERGAGACPLLATSPSKHRQGQGQGPAHPLGAVASTMEPTAIAAGVEEEQGGGAFSLDDTAPGVSCSPGTECGGEHGFEGLACVAAAADGYGGAAAELAAGGTLPAAFGTQDVAGLLLGIARGGDDVRPPPRMVGEQPSHAGQGVHAEGRSASHPSHAAPPLGSLPAADSLLQGCAGEMMLAGPPQAGGGQAPAKTSHAADLPQAQHAQHAQQGGVLQASARHNQQPSSVGGSAAWPAGGGWQELGPPCSNVPRAAEGVGGGRAAKGATEAGEQNRPLQRNSGGSPAWPGGQQRVPPPALKGGVAGGAGCAAAKGQSAASACSGAAAAADGRGGGKHNGGVGGSRGACAAAQPPQQQQGGDVQSVVDLFAGAEAEQQVAGRGGQAALLPTPAAGQAMHAQQDSAGAALPTRVFVLTSLGSRQQVNVNDCIRKLRGLGRADKEDWVSERTTHVLIATDDHGLAQVRSMKYMMGVARGCWVVSYAWLDACMEAGCWVPEHAFEAKGDKTGRGAPMKARVQRRSAGGGGLFRGITAYVHRPSTLNSQNGRDLARLLEAGGATVLERLSPGTDLGSIKLFVPGTDDAAVKAAKELKASIGARVIMKWDWVFDSLSNWQPQPQKQKYLFK